MTQQNDHFKALPLDVAIPLTALWQAWYDSMPNPQALIFRVKTWLENGDTTPRDVENTCRKLMSPEYMQMIFATDLQAVFAKEIADRKHRRLVHQEAMLARRRMIDSGSNLGEFHREKLEREQEQRPEPQRLGISSGTADVATAKQKAVEAFTRKPEDN